MDDNEYNELRVPRPLGLTLMSLKHQRTNSADKKQEALKELQSHLIKHWLSNNFTINETYVNQQTLQQLYNIDIGTIREAVSSGLSNTITDTNDLNSLIRASLEMTFAWTLEDRGQVAEHIAKIKQSEGGQYKPFITSELTKALKLGSESTANMLKLMQAIAPANSQQNLTQIFIGQDSAQEANTLTTEKALELLNMQHMGTLDGQPRAELPEGDEAHPIDMPAPREGTIDPKSKEAQELYSKHNLEAQPTVAARQNDTENNPALRAQALKESHEQRSKKAAEHRADREEKRAAERGLT